MKCSKCNIILSIKNAYKQADRKSGLMSYCKECFNKKCIERWITRKIKAIEYLGGKCLDCNKTYPYYVYDFHHRFDEIKEFDWTKLRLRSWKSITEELDKCDLLCANCHRIRHGAST